MNGDLDGLKQAQIQTVRIKGLKDMLFYGTKRD